MKPFLVLLIAAVATQGQLPGRQCGDRSCLRPDARCEDATQGICECKGNLKGDGYLACQPSHYDMCFIVRASTVTNFDNGRSYRLTVPCKYLASSFTTSMETRQGNTIGCSVKVHSLSERVAGRFWQRGFEATIITERSGTSVYQAYRVRGTRDANEYTYLLEKKNGPEDFWFEIMSVDEPTVQFGLDDVNSRATLEVTNCGLSIVYRPELASEGRFQNIEPGLVISVDNQAVDVTWPTTDEGVCLTPTQVSGGDTSQDKAQALGLTQPYAMNYLAFTNSDETLHQTAPCSCEDVGRTLKRCSDPTKRRAAFDRCAFILDNPPFVTCMERRGFDSSTVLSLFDLCLQAFCTSAPGKCRRVQSGIRDKGCSDRAEAQFMNLNCNNIV